MTPPPNTDDLLANAIEQAFSSAKGWSSEAEKEAYLQRITDDDYIHPLFASSPEEMEKSGMSEAFSSLIYDDDDGNAKDPMKLMLEFKQKGNDSFLLGKKNKAKNVQYYRDAVNSYYESLAWAAKVVPVGDDVVARFKKETDENDDTPPPMTTEELEVMKSTLCANAAMAHFQLKNWGFVRDYSEKALSYNPSNIKAHYRLAKAYHHLTSLEKTGDAIDRGLSIDPHNADLLKMKKQLSSQIKKARTLRQQREKHRALRVKSIKEVWKWTSSQKIKLGRVPLVHGGDDDDEDDDVVESRWHSHFPHSGLLPQPNTNSGEETLSSSWLWPCLFLYPSHSQSDFIKEMDENDLLALHMAHVLPELEQEGDDTTFPWDTTNEFVCSNMAIYFEAHLFSSSSEDLIHPDAMEPLLDLKTTMRFYEASRALKGDEGDDMATVARCVERRRYERMRRRWVERYGSVYCKSPDERPCPVVRVHPGVTLREVLVDERMVVPNFLVTFMLFPMEHPAHDKFLSERQCLGIIQPKN